MRLAKVMGGVILSVGVVIAYADIPAPEMVNKVTLGLSSTFQNYGELSDSIPDGFNKGAGKYYDTERGNIPGLQMDLEKTFSSVYFNFNTALMKGDVAYNRPVSSTGYPAFTGSSGATIANVEAALGYLFPLNQKLFLLPAIRSGYHYWERNISPQGIVENTDLDAYVENYSNYYLAAEGQLIWQIVPAFSTRVRVDVGKTLKPSMHSDLASSIFSPVPGTISQTYTLQSEPYFQTALDADYVIHDRYILGTGVSYTRYSYGHSPVYQTLGGGVMEPTSVTHNTTVYLSAGLKI